MNKLEKLFKSSEILDKTEKETLEISKSDLILEPQLETEGKIEPDLAPDPSYKTDIPSEPTEMQKAMGEFVVWLKADWLLKLGAFLMLIAFGWFVKFAFDSNWIGPLGRIALGLLGGSGILTLGWWRMKKFPMQGSVLLILGSTAILLTTFAARVIYGFFSPITALPIMLLSTAFVALASVKFNARYLALASLLLASIAPIMVGSNPDMVTIFAYLFATVLGAIWIMAIKGWRELTFASLVIVTLYSVGSISTLSSISLNTLLLFAYVFTVLFFITNILGIVKLKTKNKKELMPDLFTAAGTGLFILSWIFVAAQDEWHSTLIAAWMIIFTTGAFLIFKITKRLEPFYVYSGVSLVLLAAATASELSGPALTIAYLAEALVIIFVADRLIQKNEITEKLTILLLPSMVLSLVHIFDYPFGASTLNKDAAVLFIFTLALAGLALFFYNRSASKGLDQMITKGLILVGSIYALFISFGAMASSKWNNGFLNEDFAVLLIFIGALAGVGYFFKNKNTSQLGEEGQKLHDAFVNGFYIASSIYAYILVWLTMHAEFSKDIGTMISLVIYTIVGIIFYIKGTNNSKKGYLIYGGTLLVFVVGRLLLIEVWRMELGGRVITFFLIGILLMSTAFLSRKNIKLINSNKNDENKN